MSHKIIRVAARADVPVEVCWRWGESEKEDQFKVLENELREKCLEHGSARIFEGPHRLQEIEPFDRDVFIYKIIAKVEIEDTPESIALAEKLWPRIPYVPPHDNEEP